MLILIFLTVSAIVCTLVKKFCPRFEVGALALKITSLIIAAFCLIGLCVKVASEDSKKAELQAKHDAIIQMIGNKDNVITLTRDIAEYNGEILSGREAKKSLLFGVFVYNCYDELPTIEVGHLEHAG